MLSLLFSCGERPDNPDVPQHKDKITISLPETGMTNERIPLEKEASFEGFYQKNIVYEIVGANEASVTFEHELVDNYYYTYLVATDPGTVTVKLTYKEGDTVRAVSNEATITFSCHTVSNEEELKALASSSKTYKLTEDISLGGRPWSPIEFSGKLIGDGHKISNFKLDQNQDNLGFFSTLSGICEDVIFENVEVLVYGAKNNVGIIAGKLASGTISGCTVNGVVNAEYSTNVGGIAGYSDNGSVIQTSKSYAQVKGKTNVGGIVGYSLNIISTVENNGKVIGETDTGGIVGNFNGKNIQNATNNADVESQGSFAGGIVGDYNAGNIQNLTNTGNISARGNQVGGIIGMLRASNDVVTGFSSTGSVTGAEYVGGYFGEVKSYSKIIANLKNTSTVTGKRYVGGIAGYSAVAIEGCENKGAIISTGPIMSGSDPLSYVGGIAGYSTGLKGCTNSSAISAGGNYVGGISGYNTSSATTVMMCVNTGKVEGNMSVGGILGLGCGQMIECENRGAVTGTYRRVGGLVGESYLLKLELCKNSGAVTTIENCAGGLIGYQNGSCSITGCKSLNSVSGQLYVGGYVGYATSYNLSINGAENSSEISGGAYVGGIIGYATSSTALNSCKNTGTIHAYGVVESGSSDPNAYTGGISGNGGVIKNCTNSGTVTGYGRFVGGIVGNAQSSVEYSENNGSVSATYICVGGICGTSSNTVIGCKNAGTVNGSYRAAGIVGEYTGSNISDCTNSGAISATGYAAGILGNVYSTVNMTNCTNSGSITADNNCASLIAYIANYGVTIRGSKNTYSALLGPRNFVAEYNKNYTLNGVINFVEPTKTNISVNNPEASFTSDTFGTYAANASGTVLNTTIVRSSGSFSAGSTAVYMLSATDTYGNSNCFSFEVKLYGTPTVTEKNPSITYEDCKELITEGIAVTYHLNPPTEYAESEATEIIRLKDGDSIINMRDLADYFDGYTFIDWYENAECTGDPYDFSKPITKEVSLYAKWGRIEKGPSDTEAISITGMNNSATNYHTINIDSTIEDSTTADYVYFVIPETGSYSFYAKVTSNYAYANYKIYNVTESEYLSSSYINKTSFYSPISFNANRGDIIRLEVYREKSYSSYYTTEVSVYFSTSVNTEVTGTVPEGHIAKLLLAPKVTDSFGEEVECKVTLLTESLQQGNPAIFRVEATDKAGNVLKEEVTVYVF